MIPVRVPLLLSLLVSSRIVASTPDAAIRQADVQSVALHEAAASDPVATILCWHEVDAAPTHSTIARRDATAPSSAESRRYTTAPADFRAQLDELATNGHNVIPLALLIDYLEGKVETLPPRAVVLTVDDGWLCAFTEIYPEMKRRNLPWTLFVYPKVIGRGTHAVTWQQVREMSADGVDIQSHSLTHPFLTAKNNGKVAEPDHAGFLMRELDGSRERIEAETHRPVESFCFPFGDHDDTVVAALETSGYRAGLTTQRAAVTRRTSPLRLPRYLIHNTTTIEEFRGFLDASAPE